MPAHAMMRCRTNGAFDQERAKDARFIDWLADAMMP